MKDSTKYCITAIICMLMYILSNRYEFYMNQNKYQNSLRMDRITGKIEMFIDILDNEILPNRSNINK